MQPETKDSERSSTWRALENSFLETPIKADERPEAVEVAASADWSQRGLPTLIGVLDLVRSGRRIVGFKLAAKTQDVEMVVHTIATQLRSYSALYRDATDHKEGGLELHHMVRTRKQKPKVIVT